VKSDDLAARYGQTRAHGRRNRFIALVTAAVFAVVLVGWVVWAGLDNSGAQLEAKDTGHTVFDSELRAAGAEREVRDRGLEGRRHPGV
jgi:hypothetical protein